MTTVVSGTTGGWARCRAVLLTAVVAAVLAGCSAERGGSESVSAPGLGRLGVADAGADGPASTACDQVTVRIELPAALTS